MVELAGSSVAEFGAEFGGRGSFGYRSSVFDASETPAVCFLSGFIVGVHDQYHVGEDGLRRAAQYYFGITLDPVHLVLCGPLAGFPEAQEGHFFRIKHDFFSGGFCAAHWENILSKE